MTIMMHIYAIKYDIYIYIMPPLCKISGSVTDQGSNSDTSTLCVWVYDCFVISSI